jgi:uncharacterized protein
MPTPRSKRRLPWITIHAFARIATNSRIQANPLSPKGVFSIVQEWLAQPGVVPLNPGPLHPGILQKPVAVPLVPDAVLAALTIEHGAVLASTDHDFSRFPDLRWLNRSNVFCPSRNQRSACRQSSHPDGCGAGARWLFNLASWNKQDSGCLRQ